jgi:hypothetical protein
MRLADWEMKPGLPPVAQPYHMPSHAPVFMVSPDSVQGALPQGWQNGRFQDPGDPTGNSPLLIHVLNNELITLGVDYWPRLTFAKAIPADQAQPRPADGDRSLWWIPRLSEISPDDQWCAPEFLTAAPEEFEDLALAARLEIGGGALCVERFNGEDTPNVWSFGVTDRSQDGDLMLQSTRLTWNRAVGNQIACSIEVPGPSIKISFLSGDLTSNLLLRPEGADRTVQVTIANAELENVVMKPPDPVWAQPLLPDPDFQAFYSLAARQANRPQPVPVQKNGQTVLSGIGSKTCAQAAFSGRKP